MNNAASIEGYLNARTLARPRLRRVETPVETPAIGAALEQQPPEDLSEEKFVRFAEENPARLVELIRSSPSLRPALLTFAAEAAGRIANTALVVSALLPLLGHSDAVVREGAIYGLQPHLEASLEAREALRTMVAREPSPGVKAAVNEALATLA